MNLKRYSRPLTLLFIVAATMSVVMGMTAPLVDAPAAYLAADGVVMGLLLALLWLMLRRVVRVVVHTSLPELQKRINYGALALLFVLCWLGAWIVSIFSLFPYDMAVRFAPTFPARAVTALLLYCLVVLGYEYRECRGRQEREPAAGPEPPPAPAAVEPQREEEKPEWLGHVAVRNGQKIDLLFIADIAAILAEGDYVMIHTGKGRFIKEQTMKYFADHLPPDRFVRVHRSAIVNIDSIGRIESYGKQQQAVILHNNMRVKCSAAGYRGLKKALNL